MKTTRSLLFIAVVLALTAAAGCAATPEDRWFQQRDALNTANRIYLAHVPVMNDEQVVHYGELLRAARAELDKAKAQLPRGGSTFDTTLNVVESILARVAALEVAESTSVPGHDAPVQPPHTEDTPDDTR
ncbi:MAG: hypothetical protein GC159_11555 [Phycisphaera sp.]|nr:hypothetical protein [Phycisphaera sp.]